MKKFLAFFLCFLILLTTSCTPTDSAVATTATTAVSTTTLQDQGIQNIILIIGDGMGPGHVQAGRLGMSKAFVFDDWQHTMVNTNSNNGNGEPLNTTDSAASATALATGVLTTNGYVGKDSDKNQLKTIMDFAAEYGKATGIVSTDKLYGATPAGFSGHADSRQDYDIIMASQFQSGVNLLCARYSSEAVEYRKTAADAGYAVCDSIYKAKESLSSEKGFWLLNMGDYNAADKLPKVTALALDYLSQDPDGFVLMIEQAHIDGYGHSNNFDGLPQSVSALNDTVQTIVDWIGDREDTAILITADHDTGGLQVSTEADYDLCYTCADGSLLYYSYTTMTHTNSEVDLFVYGFEPDFTQYYTADRPAAIKNTNIFDMMLDLLKDPMQEG